MRLRIARLLAAIDLVLMPSQSEGLGLAAVEGLAAARPVIAFAVGGLPEVVLGGLNGRLVPPRCSRRCATPSGGSPMPGAHVQRLIDCYRMALGRVPAGAAPS